MAPSGQLTAPALDALLHDGSLAGDWTLDPSRSQVKLRSKSMWGLAPVKGVFGQVSGGGVISAAGDVSGVINVAARSIDTGNSKRDRHLRSAEFFDAERFDSVTVRVDGIRPSGEGVTVTGSLTVRDRTRPLSFGAAVSVIETGEVWLDADVQVNRADFGLTWNQMGMASMNNTISVHAVFTRQ